MRKLSSSENKWDLVYMQVLNALIANHNGDLMERWVGQNIETDAQCLTTMARIITNEAMREIEQNDIREAA